MIEELHFSRHHHSVNRVDVRIAVSQSLLNGTDRLNFRQLASIRNLGVDEIQGKPTRPHILRCEVTIDVHPPCVSQPRRHNALAT